MKRALIIGSSGQDGTLLSRFLKKKGYFVEGLSRRPGPGCFDRLTLLDLRDSTPFAEFLQQFSGDEIYYLAAEHHSSGTGNPTSSAASLFDVNVSAFGSLLEHCSRRLASPRIFYASSALVFGDAEGVVTEATEPSPRCLYSLSKFSGHQLSGHFRSHHGMYVSVGILFNHESPLRGSAFLSKRIVEGIHAIRRGSQADLVVGDLSAQCDWGYAGDYVRAMWCSLQPDWGGDTYVIATGTLHTVHDWVKACCDMAGLDPETVVREDPALLTRRRKPLAGDSTKLRSATGWCPSMSFDQLVEHVYRDVDIAVSAQQAS